MGSRTNLSVVLGESIISWTKAKEPSTIVTTCVEPLGVVPKGMGCSEAVFEGHVRL